MQTTGDVGYLLISEINPFCNANMPALKIDYCHVHNSHPGYVCELHLCAVLKCYRQIVLNYQWVVLWLDCKKFPELKLAVILLVYCYFWEECYNFHHFLLFYTVSQQLWAGSWLFYISFTFVTTWGDQSIQTVYPPQNSLFPDCVCSHCLPVHQYVNRDQLIF